MGETDGFPTTPYVGYRVMVGVDADCTLHNFTVCLLFYVACSEFLVCFDFLTAVLLKQSSSYLHVSCLF